MIERSSVYHRPTDQYVYPSNNSTLHIRIQTRRENVTSVELIYGDQYDWVENRWIMERISMICTGTDALFDYWQAQVTPPSKRVRYGFLLQNAHETVIMTEKGFFSEPPQDPSHYFCF